MESSNASIAYSICEVMKMTLIFGRNGNGIPQKWWDTADQPLPFTDGQAADKQVLGDTHMTGWYQIISFLFTNGLRIFLCLYLVMKVLKLSHDLYNIYDTSPVNKNKLRCSQFLVNLLQAWWRERSRHAAWGNHKGQPAVLRYRLWNNNLHIQQQSMYSLPASSSISFAASATAVFSLFSRSFLGT